MNNNKTILIDGVRYHKDRPASFSSIPMTMRHWKESSIFWSIPAVPGGIISELPVMTGRGMS